MDQINKLANWIMANHPEAITEGGAGDVAIHLIKQLTKERDDALNEHEDALAWSNLWKRSSRQFRSMSQGAKIAWEEARHWAIYFKGLYEQGAPMTIAGMNTRIAELEKKVDTLTGRLNLSKLAIAARNKRISRLREVLSVVTYKPDLGCGSCIGNLVIAKRALEEDDGQTTT